MPPDHVAIPVDKRTPEKLELRRAWARANDELVDHEHTEEGLGNFAAAIRVRGIRMRLKRAIEAVLL